MHCGLKPPPDFNEYKPNDSCTHPKSKIKMHYNYNKIVKKHQLHDKWHRGNSKILKRNSRITNISSLYSSGYSLVIHCQLLYLGNKTLLYYNYIPHTFIFTSDQPVWPSTQAPDNRTVEKWDKSEYILP